MGKEHPLSTGELWGTSERSDPMEQRFLWKKRTVLKETFHELWIIQDLLPRPFGGGESSRLWLSMVTLENSTGSSQDPAGHSHVPFGPALGAVVGWECHGKPHLHLVGEGFQQGHSHSRKKHPGSACFGDTANPFCAAAPNSG